MAIDSKKYQKNKKGGAAGQEVCVFDEGKGSLVWTEQPGNYYHWFPLHCKFTVGP